MDNMNPLVALVGGKPMTLAQTQRLLEDGYSASEIASMAQFHGRGAEPRVLSPAEAFTTRGAHS